MESRTNVNRKSLLDQIIDYQEKLLSGSDSSSLDDINASSNAGPNDNVRGNTPSPMAEVMAKRHAFRACLSVSSDKDTPVESCDENYLAGVPGSVEDILENLGFTPLQPPDIPNRFHPSVSQTDLFKRLGENDWEKMDYRIMHSLELSRPSINTDGQVPARPCLRRISRIQSLDSDDLNISRGSGMDRSLDLTEAVSESQIKNGDFDRNRPSPYAAPGTKLAAGQHVTRRQRRFPLVRMATVLSLHGDTSLESNSSPENRFPRYSKTSTSKVGSDLISGGETKDTQINDDNSVGKNREDEKGRRSSGSDADLSSDSDENEDSGSDDNWFTRQQNIHRKNSEDLIRVMRTRKSSIDISTEANQTITEKRQQFARMDTECVILESDPEDGNDVIAAPRKENRNVLEPHISESYHDVSKYDGSECPQTEEEANRSDHQGLTHRQETSEVPRTLANSFRTRRYPLTKKATIEISLQSPVREPKSQTNGDGEEVNCDEYEENDDILQVSIHRRESLSTNSSLDI